MISFDQAIALLSRNVAPLGSEAVGLAEASGRTLAEDVTARIPSPRRTVSAMDGYAIRLADVVVGKPMQVIGESRPGHPFTGHLEAGQTVRIFTGGPIPSDCDCVIMQEYARRCANEVHFQDGFGPDTHIREQGSDFDVGQVLLSSGSRVEPRMLAALAAADLGEVLVRRRPRIKVLSTGDELVEPGEAIGDPFAIPDSISHAIAAQGERWGATVLDRQRAADDLPALQQQAGAILDQADLVVVTGGASVGERDFAKAMFEVHRLELIFEKVAIKPGKPVWLGRANGTLILGLPGNPTSALVTSRLFLEPILSLLQGRKGEHTWRKLPLAGPLPRIGDRETFVRARWDEAGLTPMTNQDSGVQGGLASADWLIRCPAGQEQVPCRAEVYALPF